jgi:hypothetical protein
VEGGIGRVLEYRKSCRGSRYDDNWRQGRVRLIFLVRGSEVGVGCVWGTRTTKVQVSFGAISGEIGNNPGDYYEVQFLVNGHKCAWEAGLV